MHEKGYIGDYDIFLCGKWLTTFYSITYGEALDLANLFANNPDDIKVILRV